jgi:hypothetical protein
MGGEFRPEDQALWRRWRDGDAAGQARAPEPDFVALAAYAEGRLSSAVDDAELDNEIRIIEDFLANRAEAIADIGAGRDAAGWERHSPAPEAMVLRAQSLIRGAEAGIVPFRARRASWKAIAVAASLLAAGVAGFSIGMDDWLSLTNSSGASLTDELMDPPGTMLANFDEDGSL